MVDVCLAVTIVNQLQEWLEELEGHVEPAESSVTPTAQMTYGGDGTIDIGICDFALWSSEFDKAEDMTLEYCKSIFLREVTAWLPFAVRGEST